MAQLVVKSATAADGTFSATGTTVWNAGMGPTSGQLTNAFGGTGADSSASTGIAHVAAGTWTFSAVDLSSSDATGVLAAARFPALTGDVTTASGALATTLATVNGNVGSFTSANITVNAKGLITAAANGTGGGGSSTPGAPLYASTADAGPSNSNVETSIVGTGVGSMTTPANFFSAGTVLELDVTGYLSTPLVPDTLNIKLKAGATTVGTTGATTLTASLTNSVFRILSNIICRTTGATGTFIVNTILEISGAALAPLEAKILNTSTVTLDTTGTLAWDVTATWAAAQVGELIKGTNAVMFTPGGGAITPVMQTFTTNGTYTPTIGAVNAFVVCVGAGGGGGGGEGVAAGSARSGGGAGGGGVLKNAQFKISEITTPVAITIGAAGSKGTGSAGAVGGNGGVGGNAQFGTYITAFGGGGGAGGQTGAAGGGGGASYITVGGSSTTTAGAGGGNVFGTPQPTLAGGAGGNAGGAGQGSSMTGGGGGCATSGGGPSGGASIFSAGGGGGGGGVTAATPGTSGAGGTGGGTGLAITAASGGGPAGGGANGNAGQGTASAGTTLRCGQGGPGGGANNAATGGNGGDGGAAGGGGGGGGGGTNTGGDGGNGGIGTIWVLEW